MLNRVAGQLVGSTLLVALVLGSSVLVAQASVWPDVVNQVSEDLGSGDLELRRTAARRLGQLPRSAAHRLLVAALADADTQVRVEAARVAIHTDYAPAAAIVVPWLADSDVALRRSAARVLSTFPAENRAGAALARGLNDPDASVRLAVAQALGSNPTPEGVSALMGHLDDNDTQVVLAVINALEQSADPQSAVALVGKLQDSSAVTRVAVARALGTLATEQAVTALCLALLDTDPAVRRAAAVALGRARSQAAIEPLARVVNDDKESLELRNTALRALGQFPTATALEKLLAARNPARPELSQLASKTLARLGPRCAANPECLQALQLCVSQDPLPERAESCAEALGRSHAANAYDIISQAFQRGGIGVESATRAYGELRDARALPSLLQMLSHLDVNVRLLAIDATLQILLEGEPDGRAVEPIAHALGAANRSTEERAQLINLLGATRTARTASLVEPLLAPGTPLQMRLPALRAMGRLGIHSPAGQRALLGALNDPEDAVRFEAARAIRRAGDAALAGPLLAELERGTAVDPFAQTLALSGPLAKTTEGKLLARIGALIARSTTSNRDGLLETLAQVPNATAIAELARHGRQDLAARAKVAEALAGSHGRSPEPEANVRERLNALEPLLSDPNVRVRANAVWSAGVVAGRYPALAKQLLPKLKLLLADLDESVAANASVAFARAAKHAAPDALALALCPLVNDTRAYVRANALTSLSWLHVGCLREAALQRLARDRSVVVRQRAAMGLGKLLRAQADPALGQALGRCAQSDVSSAVASTCEASLADPADDARPGKGIDVSDWATIFIVPAASLSPVAEAPFALALPSGWLRLGFADRRGGVFEASEAGALALEVPAGSAAD